MRVKKFFIIKYAITWKTLNFFQQILESKLCLEHALMQCDSFKVVRKTCNREKRFICFLWFFFVSFRKNCQDENKLGFYSVELSPDELTKNKCKRNIYKTNETKS